MNFCVKLNVCGFYFCSLQVKNKTRNDLSLFQIPRYTNLSGAKYNRFSSIFHCAFLITAICHNLIIQCGIEFTIKIDTNLCHVTANNYTHFQIDVFHIHKLSHRIYLST